MLHSFDVDEAVRYGIEKAVILSNLKFWITKNVANKKHIHDGFCWTYNSSTAFSELFPYLSSQKISRLLREMETDELIKSGNYNKAGYDRTKWYTVPSLFIVQNQTMDCSNLKNGLLSIKQPIPDIKTYIKTYIDPIPPKAKDKFDFERCLKVWNAVADGNKKLSKHRSFPKKAKGDLPKTYKVYKNICNREGKEPAEFDCWVEAYFEAVSSFRSEWPDDYKRTGAEYACRETTYDKVLEWADND